MKLENWWKYAIVVMVLMALIVGAIWVVPRAWRVVTQPPTPTAIPPAQPAVTELPAQPAATQPPTVPPTATQPPTVPPTAETQLPTPTLPPTGTPTPTSPTAQPTAAEPTQVGTGNVETVFKAKDAFGYPLLQVPNPERQPEFPYGLAEYLTSWESNDYFHNNVVDVDVPQWSYRMITSGRIVIDKLGINCEGDEITACGVVIINHFGPTAYWEDAVVDSGFTVVGLVFDMETPEKVSLAAQALLDHQTYRVTISPDGSNCGTRDACQKFEWHVVVIGNGEPQVHWTGVYFRP